MGLYNKGMRKRLVSWLNDYSEARSIGLLKCIVPAMPGTWTYCTRESYGIIISNVRVYILRNPGVMPCIIQDDYQSRHMISYGIVVLQNQQGPAIPPNQFEVWIVEN